MKQLIILIFPGINLNEENTCYRYTHEHMDYLQFRLPEVVNGVSYAFNMVGESDSFSDILKLHLGQLTINGSSVRYRYYTLTVSIMKKMQLLLKHMLL